MRNRSHFAAGQLSSLSLTNLLSLVICLLITTNTGCGMGEIRGAQPTSDAAVPDVQASAPDSDASVPESDTAVTEPDAAPCDDITGTPDATTEPDTVANPDTTPEADTTPEPDATPESDSGVEPDATAEPDTVANPDTTPEADTTPEPDATTDPDAGTADTGPDTTADPATTIDCANDSTGLHVTIYGPISAALISQPTNPGDIQFGANQVGGVSGAQWNTCYGSSDPRPTVKYFDDIGPYRITLPAGTDQFNFYLLEAGAGCATHWFDLNPGTAWQVTGDCQVSGTLLTVK